MLAVSVFVIDCTTIRAPPPSATFPASREELETLSGLGQYIVSAILLSVYRQGEPLLDVNMARVLERYFGPRKLAVIKIRSLPSNIVAASCKNTTGWLELGYSRFRRNDMHRLQSEMQLLSYGLDMLVSAF